jgi:hypothetical protein
MVCLIYGVFFMMFKGFLIFLKGHYSFLEFLEFSSIFMKGLHSLLELFELSEIL